MKHQALFSLKNNEKIFKTVVCCSRDWHLKVTAVARRKFGYGQQSVRSRSRSMDNTDIAEIKS